MKRGKIVSETDKRGGEMGKVFCGMELMKYICAVVFNYCDIILNKNEMAIIRMTAQEARDNVEKNNSKLQTMDDAAPFADEDPNLDAKPVARGFSAFREYICNKKKDVKAGILQT